MAIVDAMDEATNSNTMVRDQKKTRRMKDRRLVVIAVGPPEAASRDLPAILFVEIDAIRTEMKYKHYSSAFSAATQIVRALHLMKMPKIAVWRSKALAP